MHQPVHACPTDRATTVREWQRLLKWPPTKEDEANLDRLLAKQIAHAQAKCVELGLPRFCHKWVRRYIGTTARGTHHWESAIRTGGENHDIFDQAATRDGLWRCVERWSHSYRSVLICPKHRLTLTYCEGDVSLVYCPTPKHFFAELRDAHLFYATHN